MSHVPIDYFLVYIYVILILHLCYQNSTPSLRLLR